MTTRCLELGVGWRHELRVVATGIQVMFGFLLMSPTIHHRILFRHHEKPYLIRVGNRLAIAAMVLLALSFTGILVLVSDVVLGGAMPAVVGAVTALVIAGIWFGLPLGRRVQERSGRRLSE